MSEAATLNPFPSVLFTETAGASVAVPAAGKQRVYIDPTTHHASRKDSSSVLRDLETIQSTLSADPASPVNGTWWVTDDGGSPASIALKFRKGGVTYVLAEVTL